ncbi:MAG: class I SAM-dependent methyltransferase [Verrucomicrobiales bacterium]|nr:class I SAM-dependent methyltransferase [Verrucomicrobiales bacterium]
MALPEHTILEHCPLCNGTKHKPWREKDGYHVVECEDCSFIFIQDYPSADYLRKFYAPTYQPEGDTFIPAGGFLRKLKYLAFSKWIASKFPKDKPIKTFEIGCGQGDFLSSVKDNPRFDARGVDYAEAPLAYAQSRGLNAQKGDIQSMGIEDDTFDLVVALHVLEHVHDLNQTLGEIYRILRPGGMLFAIVPSVTHFKAKIAGQSWKYLGPPGHMWYLSPQTFAKFVTKAGFSEILHCSHFYHRAHVRILAKK